MMRVSAGTAFFSSASAFGSVTDSPDGSPDMKHTARPSCAVTCVSARPFATRPLVTGVRIEQDAVRQPGHFDWAGQVDLRCCIHRGQPSATSLLQKLGALGRGRPVRVLHCQWR